MAKKAHKIEVFDGGINQRSDARDMEENQLYEAYNIDVSQKGRIIVSGNGQSVYEDINSLGGYSSPHVNGFSLINGINFEAGKGLFVFSHDFNMGELGVDTPSEIGTEFLCINDGAHIAIWDSLYNTSIANVGLDQFRSGVDANSDWNTQAITLGSVHSFFPSGSDIEAKVNPIYYKADNGLRVCDGAFSFLIQTSSLSEALDSTETGVDVVSGSNYIAGEYIKIDSEVMKITSIDGNTLSTIRAQFGTIETAHDTGANIYKINVPKILTHIKRPLLEKAEGADAANTVINRWVEDIQMPEMPSYGTLEVVPSTNPIGHVSGVMNGQTLRPDGPEKVVFGLNDSVNDIQAEYFMEAGTAVQLHSGNTTESVVIFTLVNGSGTDIDVLGEDFAIGKSLSVFNAVGDGVIYNGVWEIVGFGDDKNEVKIACEYQSYTPPAGDNDEVGVRVVLEEQLISDDLKNKWIFGMSYLYDGGGSVLQESNIRTGSISGEGEDILSYSSTVFADGTPNVFQTAEYADITATDTFNATKSDNWDWITEYSKARCDGNGWLLADDSSSPITAGAYYRVSIDVSSYTSGNFDVYIGKDGDSSGGTSQNISAKGTYKFTLQAQETGADLTNVIAIKSNAFNGDLNAVQVWSVSTVEMSSSSAVDLRGFHDVALSSLTFLCNDSRSGTTQYNSWNERISGFRIYMKQVDMIGGGLSEEWLLLYDVDLVKGTYICHGKDGGEEKLQLANLSGTSNDWDVESTDSVGTTSLVTTSILGDRVASIPLLTYESENGWPADTNLAAMYKTAATVQRKVYIGNLKIGERTYPDRMLRADADKFDSFPSDGTHYIDVATADGDDIISLKSVGDKLLQFKTKNVYLIEITSEGEELKNTWEDAGIKSECQVVNVSKGVVWINSNGLYFYDGKELKYQSQDKFTYSQWPVREDSDNPPIMGYDSNSNKVIIYTTNYTPRAAYEGFESEAHYRSELPHSGLIYDLDVGAFTQGGHLFNWYSVKKVKKISETYGTSISATVLSDNQGVDAIHSPSESTNKDDKNLFATNMINTKNQNLILAYNHSNDPTKVNITQWKDSPQRILSFSTTPSVNKLVPVTNLKWTIYPSAQLAYATDDTTTFNTASPSRKLETNSGTTVQQSLYRPVTPGSKYKFDFWTRGASSKELQYRIYDNVNRKDIQAFTNTGVSGDTWTRVTKTFIAPSNSVRLYFRSPTTNGAGYVDDVSLKLYKGLSIKTKDIDFKTPSVRKKIYKVYVTFKAGGYMSGIIAKYATNGSNDFSGTFDDATYYSATKGFDSFVSHGSSTSDWITAELKPSSSINNVYSIQLHFEYADAGTRNKFAADMTSAHQGVSSNEDAIIAQLASDASSTDDYYNGMPLFVYKGDGAGQEWRINDYDATGGTLEKQITFSTQESGSIPADFYIKTSSYYDIGYIPSEFEINDISIVYREKPVK
jgi:hypothetical protein